LCSEADTIGDGKANWKKIPEADLGLREIQPKNDAFGARSSAKSRVGMAMVKQYERAAQVYIFNEILFGASFIETTCWMGASIN
jgi:hypothetical protein